MDSNFEALTVFFDDPFWVGVFERIENGKLTASRVTFGAEPKDYEIYEYIGKYYYRLKFSPAVAAETKASSDNPKKQKRDISRALSSSGVGTKSQQALRLQYEQRKAEQKAEARDRKAEDSDRKFQQRQQKKKEKHRGK